MMKTFATVPTSHPAASLIQSSELQNVTLIFPSPRSHTSSTEVNSDRELCSTCRQQKSCAQHYFFLVWKKQSLETNYEDNASQKHLRISQKHLRGAKEKESLKSGWRPLLATTVPAASRTSYQLQSKTYRLWLRLSSFWPINQGLQGINYGYRRISLKFMPVLQKHPNWTSLKGIH